MSIVANRPIEEMRAGAGRAFRWWIGELYDAACETAKWLREKRGNTLTVEVGERHWLVRRGRRQIGAIEGGADGREGGFAASLRDLLAREGGAAETVVVVIPPERVLSKTIDLPAGARTQLDRILPFEMSRHFPLGPERVFFAHRVIRRPIAGTVPGTAPLMVEIAAVPRDIVLAIAAELAAARLRVSAFALVPVAGATPLLLPSDPMVQPVGGTRPRRLLLAAVAALALVAILSWPAAQQMRLAAIDREIAALKPKAEIALQARTRQQRETDQAAAITKLRSTRAAMVAVLDRLSRDVPDGAWLLSLSVTGRDVVLDGLAPSAAAIALALEHDPDFAGIVFRSPIARDAASGREHFQLGATLAEAAR
ncbi:MAG TPA: PilN domain-containing protein [Stellaceae bacterium]|jgi:general secretion pathway protein L|nr:PilN domain-containing protein [Stellaceae bacterium]